MNQGWSEDEAVRLGSEHYAEQMDDLDDREAEIEMSAGGLMTQTARLLIENTQDGKNNEN